MGYDNPRGGTSARFSRTLRMVLSTCRPITLPVNFRLFELKRTFKQSTNPFDNQGRKWTYDLISSSDEITFVAEVPSPDTNVSVELNKGKLKVKSSRDFAKEIELADPVELVGLTCVNGILNVRLRKIDAKDS